MAKHRYSTHVDETGRVCTKCQTYKSWDQFSRSSNHSTGHTQLCKTCVSEYAASDYARNGERRRASMSEYWKTDRGKATVRRYALNRLYRLTPERYELMLEVQDGLCGLCGDTESVKTHRLSVDHDRRCCPTERTCGECVRSLLCRRCNRMVGLIESKPVIYKAFGFCAYLDMRTVC